MRAATLRAGFAAFIIVILVAAPQAQQAQAAPQAPSFGASSATGSPRDPGDHPVDIDLLVGRSTVLNVGAPISRVSLTVPDVADAMVTAPGQLLIHGKSPGTISLFVWDKSGSIKTYEVNVRRDLTIHFVQSVDEVLLLALTPSVTPVTDTKKDRRVHPPFQ